MPEYGTVDLVVSARGRRLMESGVALSTPKKLLRMMASCVTDSLLRSDLRMPTVMSHRHCYHGMMLNCPRRPRRPPEVRVRARGLVSVVTVESVGTIRRLVPC